MKTLAFWRYLGQLACSLIIAALIGGLVGLAQVYAETKTRLFVPGAGSVGSAATVGQFLSGGTKEAKGWSATTVTIYKIINVIKVMHLGAVSSRNIAECQNCTYKETQKLGWATYGDSAVTQSSLQGYSSSSAVYYTSYPDESTAATSCYRYWSTGQYCTP